MLRVLAFVIGRLPTHRKAPAIVRMLAKQVRKFGFVSMKSDFRFYVGSVFFKPGPGPPLPFTPKFLSVHTSCIHELDCLGFTGFEYNDAQRKKLVA